MNKSILAAAFCCHAGFLFSSMAFSQGLVPASPSDWYRDGAEQVLEASRRSYANDPSAARNIILFIGDGMGVSTVTAARIRAGQQQGLAGEEHVLSFERFPWSGLSKTYNTNQQTPDSAGAMTAIMTGVKTRAGVIGVDETLPRGDCASYIERDPRLITALELAEIAGLRTGLVTTTRVTHATPAATYAKSPERNWEDSADLDAEAKALGCADIARQLLEFETNLEAWVNQGRDHPAIDGLDVALGGGRSQFFGTDPDSLEGFAEAPGEGRRDDGRNLIQEWIDDGGIYVMDQRGFDNLDTDSSARVLGLFNASHLRFEADRHNDAGGEPSLAAMTGKAIELLKRGDQGFFLMVEAGRIDHAHHDNSAYNALEETVELARAVEVAVQITDASETLIIVTADHSHVMTFAGYPTRGNPILGKVVGNDAAGNPQAGPSLDAEGRPYTTLSYANGPGFASVGEGAEAAPGSRERRAGRADLEAVATEAPDYHQEVLVPLRSETHGGEDVAIYASGPGAHLLSGVLEQNVIFHVMNFAGDLENRARAALE